MPYLNEARLMGHLGRDPELKYTGSGRAVANFSIATTRRWNGQGGERQEETTWHRIVAWGKTAEIARESLRKGDLALVAGRITERRWEGKDGQERRTTEIVADRVYALHGRKRQERAQPSGGGDAADTFADDQIPFAPELP